MFFSLSTQVTIDNCGHWFGHDVNNGLNANKHKIFVLK